MTLFHPSWEAFLQRLRPRYSKKYGGQAETPRLPAGNREPLTAQRKPNLIQSIAMTAAIAFLVPNLPARVAAQGVQYSVLHSFDTGANEGNSPVAPSFRPPTAISTE